MTVVACVASLISGYAFGSHRIKTSAPRTAATLQAPVDPASRAAALDAIDEAVTARFNDRYKDALDALRLARGHDPTLTAVNLITAEIALADGNLSTLRSEASAAIRSGGVYATGAKVLLGIESWISRGTSESQAAEAAERAGVFFSGAAESDPFDESSLMFWSDILRSSGQERDGLVKAQSSIFRVEAWDSSMIVACKSALAADEAGLLDPATLAFAPEAAVSVRRVLVAGLDLAPSARHLANYLIHKQLHSIACDAAFLGGAEFLNKLTTASAPSGWPVTQKPPESLPEEP